MSRRAALGLALALVAGAAIAHAHTPAHPHTPGVEERLPVIGTAPPFALTSQDRSAVSLDSFPGKVLAVTFIYTYCSDICPLLTDRMVQVQDELGADFGSRIAFVSITVDPERDTAEVLRDYADSFGANKAGWAFLSGPPDIIDEVARRYGVVVERRAEGVVGHTLLTSLVDRQRRIRVQYLGYRFDPEEFRADLLRLADEP